MCGSPLQVQQEDSESTIPADSISDHSFILCSVDCIFPLHIMPFNHLILNVTTQDHSDSIHRSITMHLLLIKLQATISLSAAWMKMMRCA